LEEALDLSSDRLMNNNNISRWWNSWSARHYGMVSVCSGRYGLYSIMRVLTKYKFLIPYAVDLQQAARGYILKLRTHDKNYKIIQDIRYIITVTLRRTVQEPAHN
jgi:hypothetical protein